MHAVKFSYIKCLNTLQVAPLIYPLHKLFRRCQGLVFATIRLWSFYKLRSELRHKGHDPKLSQHIIPEIHQKFFILPGKAGVINWIANYLIISNANKIPITFPPAAAGAPSASSPILAWS